ncbi:MAG: NAD(P)/FAD-dependent oxidoreductase [Gammaproteobacteria bacterium]|nr:NAD(P)/FAD-dependent oxidoreductase [Gammaproteobacteria bacterium]MDE2251970.1 NAD(P)/FAD-dependent oxidoreductase [Gammaproteobacteria bacterium]
MIGGGFAGLGVVRGLRHAALDLLLIDRTNHHVFQPLLYQVATAGLAAPSIAAPLRRILRQQANVTVYLGEVSAIDVSARRVHAGERSFEYDYLVVATGTRHAYFGHDEWAQHAPGLKSLEDAFGIRARILDAFEQAEMSDDQAQRAAWLSFVVVGGGPTGVELAGTLAEIAHHTLRQEFRRIDPTRSRVRLVEAGPRVLPAFPASLSAAAQRQLAHLGVEVSIGRAITAVDAHGVRIGDEFMAARTVLWAAGVAASPLGRQLGAELDRAGRVQVATDLSVPAHPEIFVAGDLASVTGAAGAVPGIAPAAKQMGRHVARNLQARLAGRASAAFRYRHYGLLATVGRMAAVVDMGWLRLSGLLAWWFWLLAHIYFLIGFRNRLVVLIDWASAYFTYERGARIIVRSDQSG